MPLRIAIRAFEASPSCRRSRRRRRVAAAALTRWLGLQVLNDLFVTVAVFLISFSSLRANFHEIRSESGAERQRSSSAGGSALGTFWGPLPQIRPQTRVGSFPRS